MGASANHFSYAYFNISAVSFNIYPMQCVLNIEQILKETFYVLKKIITGLRDSICFIVPSVAFAQSIYFIFLFIV